MNFADLQSLLELVRTNKAPFPVVEKDSRKEKEEKNKVGQRKKGGGLTKTDESPERNMCLGTALIPS